jgi:sporulation protein YlmC with PRC-barrel domain
MKQLELRLILGKRVVDSEGETIGHLEEVEAERGDEYCTINSYIVEHRGLLDRVSSWALTSSMQSSLARRQSSQPYRIGWSQMDLSDPEHPRALVPKELLDRVRR